MLKHCSFHSFKEGHLTLSLDDHNQILLLNDTRNFQLLCDSLKKNQSQYTLSFKTKTSWLSKIKQKLDNTLKDIKECSKTTFILSACVVFALLETILLQCSYAILHPTNFMALLSNPTFLAINIALLLTLFILIIAKALNNTNTTAIFVCILDGFFTSYLIVESFHLNYANHPYFWAIIAFAICMGISQLIGNGIYALVYFNEQKKQAVPPSPSVMIPAPNKDLAHTTSPKQQNNRQTWKKRFLSILLGCFILFAIIMSTAGIFFTKYIAAELLALQHSLDPTLIMVLSIIAGSIFGLKTMVNFINNYYQLQIILSSEISELPIPNPANKMKGQKSYTKDDLQNREPAQSISRKKATSRNSQKCQT